jgi:hypothetical protein
VSWGLARELLFVIVAIATWGVLRWGSLDYCGKCGRSYGRGHLGRRDGRDRSVMTACRHYRSIFCGNRGVVRVGGCFAGVHARGQKSR